MSNIHIRLGSGLTDNQKELLLLKVATSITIVYAIIAITIALASDSQAMLLDGMYSMIDIAISFLSIYVVKKVHQPPNEKYHFGYAKFESFMTAVDGFLLLALCCFTLVTASQDLVHPDPVDHVGVIVGFSFASIFISLGMGIFMRRAGRKWHSEVLLADSQLWIIEGCVSAGICVAFSIGMGMQYKPGWEQYTSYVDPLTCILIALAFLTKPIKIIRDSFYDMVDACPSDEIRERITNKCGECCERFRLNAVQWFRLRKAGRRLFLTVCFTAPDTPTVKEVALLKRDIARVLKDIDSELDVCVVFDSIEGDMLHVRRLTATYLGAEPDSVETMGFTPGGSVKS